MISNRRLDKESLKNIVRQALAEDVGSGDATTLAVVPDDLRITAFLSPREPCTVAGLPLVAAVYGELDRDIVIESSIGDGNRCRAGDVIAALSGPARSILTGERLALNFIQRMSGIATMTRNFVDALANSATRLLDTRKTTPGLRMLEKYAVVAGGGTNHRQGLYDMIMIKDNHRYVASLTGSGGIARAIRACRQKRPDLKVEVETDNIDQVREALAAKADFILLDNMTNAEMTEAVALRDRIYAQGLLEASGNITLVRLPEIAEIGLDYVSAGALTHSARAIDIGMDVERSMGYPETPQ